MKNKITMLALASGLTINSCAYPLGDRWPKEREYYPPTEPIPAENLLPPFKTRPGKFYRHCDYLSYPARTGDNIGELFWQEAGPWTDSSEFMEFQRWTYKKTQEDECGNCLTWRDNTIQVVKDGFIMIPDANGNGLPGE